MDQLILHESTRNLLQKSTRQLPHALLLVGRRGLGVGTIAQTIAKDAGTILEIVSPKKRQPSGSYEVDDENGSIIIDDIRTLYQRTRSKFTARQIVIIDFSGRTMSHAAQNAFLKLLEEPQEKVHFILASNSLSGLLPTVVSRCQRIDVMPVSQTQSMAILDELRIEDTTVRARILFIAEGLPAEIHRLATDKSYYEARIKTVQDARVILEGDSYTRLTVIQSYKDKRTLTLQLIDDILHQLQLSASKSLKQSSLEQLDAYVETYEKIQANGNIQLNLAKVLL